MAIASSLDPAFTTNTGTSNTVSNAFNPSAGELIVAVACADSGSSGITCTFTNNKSLTVNPIGSIQIGSSGGAVHAAWMYTSGAQTGMTITATWSGTGTTGGKGVKPTTLTGTANTSAVTSRAAANSSTNDLSASYTNGTNASRGMGAGTDWNQLGVPTSTDTEQGFDIGGAISGISVYKAANTSGTGVTVTLNLNAGGSGTAAWSYKLFEILPAAGGLSGNINQISETNTAQPIGRTKAKTLGQVVDTQTAQPLTRQKSVTLGRASETNTAQLLSISLGINQVVEINVGRSITSVKVRILGLTSSTEVARPLGRLKTRTLGQPSETNVATNISRLKRKALGQSSETNLAQLVTADGSLNVAVNRAIETNVAQSLGKAKTRTMGRSTETNLSLALSRLKLRGIGIVTDGNTARTIAPRGMLNRAFETNTATALAPSGGVPQVPDIVVRLGEDWITVQGTTPLIVVRAADITVEVP